LSCFSIFVINCSVFLFSATDEKKKDGFVYIIVSVKNLETSRTLTREGLVPKLVRKASNADVSVEFQNQ